MNQLGLGVMINYLRGNEETVKAHRAAQGKIIKSITLKEGGGNGDGAAEIRFEDGTGISIEDHGRSCCESRFITTDDDLPSFTGATFVEVELAEMPELPDGEYGDCKEQIAVRVNTTKGTATFVTHNEHNGYYGGFSMEIRPLEN
jgi:hypothetical protein